MRESPSDVALLLVNRLKTDIISGFTDTRVESGLTKAGAGQLHYKSYLAEADHYANTQLMNTAMLS